MRRACGAGIHVDQLAMDLAQGSFGFVPRARAPFGGSQTTTAGNYTITQLPVGTYELSATASGFRNFVRSGITAAAAQTLRIDVSLEVGAATESVTVRDRCFDVENRRRRGK